MDVKARAAQVARASYGRLIALLAARTRDIAAAEEALSDAFVAALLNWPEQGIPENPEAWLMTAAKNRITDAYRRQARSPVTVVEEVPDVEVEMSDEAVPGAIPDRRLALMFVCAHPAIDASVHSALMLQTVLGFEAADIARSFVVSPAALAQRLVRAKRKIKDTRVAFSIPDRSVMPERLNAVLEAIYGAYSLDWLHEPDARDLSEEACFLSRIMTELLPDEAEVLGAAALIAYSHARRKARLHEGVLVPLHEQDTRLWDMQLIAQADAFMSRAVRCQKIGRFQLEAAVQQVFSKRAETGKTDWHAILHLTEGLCRMWPTLGAEVSKAAIVTEVAGAQAGLAVLMRISSDEAKAFQPWHATHAHVLAKLGLVNESRRVICQGHRTHS